MPSKLKPMATRNRRRIYLENLEPVLRALAVLFVLGTIIVVW